MSKFKLLSAALVAIFVNLQFIQHVDAIQADWDTYSVSKNGRCKIQFPKEPVEQEKSAPTPDGPLVFNLLIAEIDATNVMISGVSGVPADDPNFDTDTALQGAVDGAAGNSGSDVAKKTTIEKFGCPGREVLLDHPAGLKMRARFYIDVEQKILFQAIVVGPDADTVYGEDSTRFLDSMTITEEGEEANDGAGAAMEKAGSQNRDEASSGSDRREPAGSERRGSENRETGSQNR